MKDRRFSVFTVHRDKQPKDPGDARQVICEALRNPDQAAVVGAVVEVFEQLPIVVADGLQPQIS